MCKWDFYFGLFGARTQCYRSLQIMGARVDGIEFRQFVKFIAMTRPSSQEYPTMRA